MPKSPIPHLRVARENASLIVDNAPTDVASYAGDANLRDATNMRFQVIGENLAVVRNSYPEFWTTIESDEFNRLIAIRNIVSHRYTTINYELMTPVIRELPRIIEQLNIAISRG